MNRRELLNLGVVAAAGTAAAAFQVRAAVADVQSRYSAAFAQLDRYAEQYMRDMNAPGMTLVLADAGGAQRVCSYGLDDLVRRTPVNGEELFSYWLDQQVLSGDSAAAAARRGQARPARTHRTPSALAALRRDDPLADGA